MRREDRSSISTYPLADLGWKLLLDSSLRDVKQDDSNNEVAPSRGGEQIDDILDGLVGAVVGDFELAVWAILRIRTAFGADLRPRTRRIFCQPCLDWSERRYHLKGLVGARILDRLLELGWLKCVSGSRALQLTSSGRAGLSEIFQIEINNEGVPTGRLCDPRRLTA